MLVGYMRVSTDTERQVLDLQRHRTGECHLVQVTYIIARRYT